MTSDVALDSTGSPYGHSTTPSEWRELGRRIALERHRNDGRASQQMWAAGDWLLHGEDVVLNNLNRRRVRVLAAEITGYSLHTLAMAASLSRRVHPSIRIDGLSWWHHLLVGKLPRADQEAWLRRAADEAWSVRTMRERLRAASVISTSSNGRHPTRVVSQLTRWKRSQLPEAAVERLREWWRREMGE